MNTESWTILGIVFGAGGVYAVMQFKITRLLIDVNRIAGIGREEKRINQRRWLMGVATQIEASTSLEEAKLHAKLLKEESWKS